MSSPAHRKPRVLVLYGGRSSEHAVSCVTAAGVIGAIDREKFDVVPVGITQSGQWTRPVVDPLTHSFDSDGGLPYVRPTPSTVHLLTGSPARHGEGTGLLQVQPDGTTTSLGNVDVVFPLLHGPYGEDGTLQGLLEMANLPYVGAGVLASAVAMDKHFMKMAFMAAGLEVGPFVTVTDREWTSDPDACLEEIKKLRLPVFVKPARAGSSNGITRVDDWIELCDAMEDARAYDPKLIIEEGIDGREIECAVLDSNDGEPVRTSIPGEIVVGTPGSHQFYDFEAKYAESSSSILACPADLPPEIENEVRRQAVTAFHAIDGEGLARADFFYTRDGRVVINEVNTMPGFTPISMYPRMWAASGVSHVDLISELLDLAMERATGLR